MKKFLYCLAISVLALNALPSSAQCPTITRGVGSTSGVVITVEAPKISPKSIDAFIGKFDHKIDIIFSDIDGTILRFDKQSPKTEIPQCVKQSVKKLQNAHVPLILTTGRSYGEASEIAKEMGNDNTYIITQQGAEITDPKGKIIYEDPIKNRDVKNVLADIESIKKSNGLTSKVVVFANGKPYATEDFKLPYNWEKITVVKSFSKLRNFKVAKICIYEQNPEKLRLVQSSLKKNFPDYHIDLSADCYCDVSSKTATKGNAIKKLADILKVDLKNSATFGDAENDISMLSQVKKAGGAAVAVGNAMESVKDNADFVTSTVFDCGFSKAIDKITINNAFLQK